MLTFLKNYLAIDQPADSMIATISEATSSSDMVAIFLAA